MLIIIWSNYQKCPLPLTKINAYWHPRLQSRALKTKEKCMLAGFALSCFKLASFYAFAHMNSHSQPCLSKATDVKYLWINQPSWFLFVCCFSLSPGAVCSDVCYIPEVSCPSGDRWPWASTKGTTWGREDGCVAPWDHRDHAGVSSGMCKVGA